MDSVYLVKTNILLALCKKTKEFDTILYYYTTEMLGDSSWVFYSVYLVKTNILLALCKKTKELDTLLYDYTTEMLGDSRWVFYSVSVPYRGFSFFS